LSNGDPQPSLAQRIGVLFSHPYMVAMAWSATVISVLFSVYLYFAGDHRPQLMYAVQPVDTAVVHGGESSKLTVSYEGNQITGDVSSGQIAFWNAGDLAIHGALKPLRIYTEPPSAHP
jgi:hypothetical protein